jgi:hypothetical protein
MRYSLEAKWKSNRTLALEEEGLFSMLGNRREGKLVSTSEGQEMIVYYGDHESEAKLQATA